MAKSLRSKIKKRWRGLKRGYLNEIAVKPQLQEISKKLQATIVGVQYRQPEKKNAFLHPEESTAQFPQWKPQKMVDLRSSAIPGSGLEYSGASRKNRMRTVQLHQHQQADIVQEEQQIDQQYPINRSLIKKDKNKKSKLRKTMVF